MIGKTISHYKILEKLGEGGMGVVYKAQDTKLKRTVALKFLPPELTRDPEAKKRFIHEAQAASALNHPNVVVIHEIDEFDKQMYIVMEYCQGETLKQLIEKETLYLEKVLEIGIQVCEGLTAAHEKGVIHRDIKPDNIKVTPKGRVKIMDFGLAKLKGSAKLTSTGSTLGTVAYMSPEQAQGMEVDHRSDIFCFGVVFYEMITGRLPFEGEHEAAIIYSIVNETPEPLARYKADVPEGLQRIVDKALDKDINTRYQSTADIIADLKGLQKERTTGGLLVPQKKRISYRRKSISHYKILEKIGSGDMGVVYKAEDTKLRRTVALKFLPSELTCDPGAKERFVHEAQAAGALDHPNICTVYEIDEAEGHTFISMACIEGQSLKDRIESGPLKLDEALDIAMQVAEGLQAAHEKGIVHRDIKSANIMVTEKGQAKIMDFGLAKLAGQVRLTRTSTTMGTVAYMSPEQARGEPVDNRTDIWSLGVVMYEVLTGQLPFKGDYEQAVMYSILNEEPEQITSLRTSVPMELERVVGRALAKSLNERYQQVDEVLLDLRMVRKEGESGISADQPNSLVSKERSIAVMYFENRSGEPGLERILVDMLTTNLSRYEEIDVVSSQRLFDILKLIGKQDVETIDRHIATAIAKRAQVKTMLLGSIIKIGNKIRINTQLCDVLTGSNVGGEQVEGTKVEDVFNMVDLLTEKVIDKLGTGASGVGGQPLKIADVTTSSYEAYKYYQRGLERIWRWEFSNAAENFQRAVDIDSTFAMAHLQLAVAKGTFTAFNPLSDLPPIRESLRLAKKYSAKATDMERGFIYAYGAFFNRDFERAEALAADLMKHYPNEKDGPYLLSMISWLLGKHDQGIRASERALEIDPTYANAYNNLAYNYSFNNDHQKAISTIKKYLALQPDVWNTYDSAWEIYIRAGQFDEAYHICEKALKKDAKWYGFHLRIGYIYLFRGEGDKAREEFHQVAILDPEREVPITRHFGYSYLFEGRYKEAFAEFKKAVELAKNIEDAEQEIRSLFDLGKMLVAQGNYPRALEKFSEARRLSPRIYAQSFNPLLIIAEYLTATTMVQKGDYGEVQARAAKIKRFIEEHHYDSYFMDFYHLLLAELHLAQGKGQAAEAAIGKVSGMTKTYSPRCRTLLADIYGLLGNTEKAISTYKNFYNDVVTRHYFIGGDYFYYFLGRSKVHYYLAKIYEQKGEKEQAIEYCSKALDQWENADKDLPELIDVEARLARLKGER